MNTLNNGLIIDSFAGGGGASTGIEWALGQPVDIAINHDIEAIRMHKTNHPHTKHYCEDVWAVDPLEATAGRPVDLFWLSPDCTHFSKAKGAKPKSKKIRGLAWIAVKWAKAVKPKVIILENVEEFKTWGPLDDEGMPCKIRRGETFKRFVETLTALGYTVSFRELRACDYGAPTSRKRLYMICKLHGQPVWPEPTHGDPDMFEVRYGLLKPWRTAAEIIDWSIPCPSIFDRKKPLVENTLRRIARGLEKFVVEDPEPFILPNNVMPYLMQYHSYGDEARGQHLDKPLLTIDASNRYALIAPYMMHYYGASTGAGIDEPTNTVTAQGQKLALVQAFLIKYYGQGTGQSLNDPLDTIVSKDRFGLITVKGEPYQIMDIGMRMLTPRELFSAQGFPESYVIDVDYKGVKYSKKQQIARVGNSVVPQVAEALVKANVRRDH